MKIPEFYRKLASEIPDRIYKFFSITETENKNGRLIKSINKNLIKSIKENYLWLSKPSDFNDPFDCNPNLISFQPTENEIKELLERYSSQGNRRSRRERVKTNVNKPYLIKKAFAAVLEEDNNYWGVCCFSKNYQNNLMWSHYADKHTGICLAFEPKKSIETFLLLNVKYTSDFEPVKYVYGNHEALLNRIVTKSIDWKYEEEMRICQNYSGPLKFDKSSLKEVIFGCKTLDEHKKTIINLMNDNKYTDIVFKQAVMKKDSFSLEFK